MNKILGDPHRLAAVAKDFVAHYERRIKEGSTVCGKAMFVCSNRLIAYDLYKQIIALRPEWESERIKMVMTRTKDDEPKLYELLGSDDDRKMLDVKFKDPESEFKIAIVVDMWITGFDVPCLDTMYIDKPLQKHTLIQTISRVNRVYQLSVVLRLALGRSAEHLRRIHRKREQLRQGLRVYRHALSASRHRGGAGRPDGEEGGDGSSVRHAEGLYESFSEQVRLKTRPPSHTK